MRRKSKQVWVPQMAWLLMLAWFTLGAGIQLCPAQTLASRDFTQIDRHALNTPKSAKSSLKRLADYLTNPSMTDLQKARAIFRWITENIEYDAQGLFTGNYGDLRPESVLQSGRAVCDGYSGIFESLGKAAGLEIVKISGYSKGYGYTIGTHFTGPPNHAWNAVKIDGQWRLFDATWGAGYLNDSRQFVREFQEHYFLTPPEEFIYDHYPTAPRWQLLDPPISKRHYEKLVYLQPAFFVNGLAIESHPNSTIQTDDQVVVTLKAPASTLLLARLEQNNRVLDRSLTFLQKTPNRYQIYAVFPRAGKYVLRVFAKQKSEPGRYSGALAYQIEARKGSHTDAGFPMLYASYDEHNVRLYYPMSGKLKSGSTKKFKLRVPEAEEVAVIHGNDFFPLTKAGALFQGEIEIKRGKMGVFAKFPGDRQYVALLQYKGF
ncbi:MAG: transglutaminase domain-containing protein [bacterium]